MYIHIYTRLRERRHVYEIHYCISASLSLIIFLTDKLAKHILVVSSGFSATRKQGCGGGNKGISYHYPPAMTDELT